MVLYTELYASDGVGDLARYKLNASAGRFVIEEDSAACIKPVALSIIHGGVVGKNFGRSVGTARM